MKNPIAGTVLLSLGTCAWGADVPPRAAPGPVQAELLAHLNVRHLATGSTLFARVTLDWSGSDCVLRKGAILQATVEQSDPRKGRNESRLALSFDKAQCNGRDLQPIDLVLAAVADAPANWTNLPESQFRMPLSFSNPHGNGMIAGFGAATIGDSYVTHLEFAGIEHRFPMRPGVRPGDVLDIKGVKLEIGTGPHRSSVLLSKSRDVSLGAFTQMLLVPAALAFRPSSPGIGLSDLAAGRTSPPPPGASPVPAAALPANDLEVCAPPGCAVDLPVTANELEGHKATSIAIAPLGYVPRANRVIDNFDDDEALAWLGPQQLLFAYNPHHLIRRSGEIPGRRTARVIRAVLLDPTTHNIVRALDWEIADSRRYLWPLDRDRILVHVGNELRVYGPGLEVERRIPIPGPLAFVRITPNGTLAAVATLQERHSPELHSQLRTDLGSEPEEDVEIAILDQELHTIAQASTVSGLMPPTLLNEGQVKLLAQPKMHYRLAMNTWDAKTTTTLARFESRCTPELASVPPDLLFLLSCNIVDGSKEYRVLRPDGKMLLRGKAGPHEVSHEAAGNNRQGAFAVKVVYAEREISPGADFKAADLEAQEVRVYRADGKRLAAVRVTEPVASHGGYALSPDGSQLAILSGSHIDLFPVPVQ